MIKIVYIILVIVSNMVDQGRIILQNFGLCNLSIPLCNVRQPYTGCPFMCNLAVITRNETVWRMRTNNVKRVY